METIDNQSFSEKNSGMTEQTMQTIRTTIPWMKFISITGFIMIGFILIAAFMNGASGSSRGMEQMLVNLITAVLCFFPNFFLFQYAANLTYFVDSKQSVDMEYAMLKQKTLYVFSGILVIIFLAFMVLALVYLIGSGFR